MIAEDVVESDGDADRRILDRASRDVVPGPGSVYPGGYADARRTAIL